MSDSDGRIKSGLWYTLLLHDMMCRYNLRNTDKGEK